LETPKKSSTYLSGYACGFFVISASFRQNSQNAHDGTLFHHPASETDVLQALRTVRYDGVAGLIDFSDSSFANKSTAQLYKVHNGNFELAH
jgi:hypothetical protein